MSHSARLLSFLVLLGTLLTVAPARAWVETTLVSDGVSLDIDRAGRAVVSHELVLRVKGSPLENYHLEGVDQDAEPEGEAQAIQSSGGKSIGLLVTRGDDGALRFGFESERGLHPGTWTLRFRYRSDLRGRGLIRARGSWVELGWVGPRFPSGLDAAKVTFRMPAGVTAPRLPEIDTDADSMAYGEAPAASFLSTLRHGAGSDELELVRSHVARGEPVLWRLWASPSALDVSAPQAAASDMTVPSPTLPSKSAPRRALPLLLGSALGMLYALLMLLKHQKASRDAVGERAVLRALVPLAPLLRVALGGVLLGGAVVLALRFEQPTLGALTGALAALCGTYVQGRHERTLRGPGRWLPISLEEAFSGPRATTASCWLDASQGRGKLALSLTLVPLAVLVAVLFRREPYLGVLAALLLPLCLPVFLTGTRRQLPSGRRDAARRRLERVQRHLVRRTEFRCSPVGRFPEGRTASDEVRLRIVPRDPIAGLLSLELGCDEEVTDVPLALVLRAREGSPAHQVFATHVSFTRGRSSEERVAIIHPRLQGRIVSLVTELVALGQAATRQQASERATSGASKVARSSGIRLATPKLGIVKEPANATRLA